MAGGIISAFPESGLLQPVRTLPRIRLDLAMRGSVTRAAGVGLFGACQLFNNVQQGGYVVPRAFTWGPSSAGPVTMSYSQGALNPGNPFGATPLLPDRSTLPGQLYTNAFGSVTPADFTLFLQSTEQSVSGEWPFAILPPNWGLTVQANVVNTAITLSFIWEFLTPEQFVEMYGVYG